MANSSADLSPSSAADARRFFVHDRSAGRHTGHVVADAGDFHDAALAYAESWASAEPELSVIVKDCESGEEQCFVVHLEDGDADPC